MKRISVIALAAIAVAIFAADAEAFDLMSQSGIYLYRPTGAGARPAPGSPPSQVVVNYNDQSAPVGFSTAVADSANVWNNVPGSSLSVGIPTQTTCCTDNIFCCTDGVNSISWVESNWIWGAATLGVTLIIDYNAATGALAETDMQINGGFPWSFDDTPKTNQVDLKSVLVHEMGHMLAIGDLYEPHFANSTMFGYMSRGLIGPASLGQDDIDAIDFLYPLTADSYPPPHITGFIKPAESVLQSRLIGDLGSQILGFDIKGYGFIQTDGVNSISIKAQQSGVDVADPALTFASFTDFKKMNADITFSGGVGSYDLLVTNPNGKTGYSYDAFQVNRIGNIAPVVTADADFSRVIGSDVNVCATATDPTGDGDGDAPLQYNFDLAVKPDASLATIVYAGPYCVTFNADRAGKYLIDVYANDGLVSGVTDSTLVTIRFKKPRHGGGSGGGGGGGGCSIDPDAGISDILPFAIFALPLFLIRRKYAACR